MARTSIYQAMTDELAADLPAVQQQILAALASAPQGCTREHLAGLIFPDKKFATADREIRDAIADMKARAVPVVSTSGGAGYRLTRDPADLSAEIVERGSRIRREQECQQGLERARHQLEVEAVRLRTREKAEQIGLWRE